MSRLNFAVHERLSETSVTDQRFQMIINRLMDRSILVYGDSKPETDLYNDALKIVDLLADFFMVMGCWLVHDTDFHYMRLYPPGADIPGNPSMFAEDDPALCDKPNQIEVACILTLYLIHDVNIRGGHADEKGESSVCMEEFRLALKNGFDRNFVSPREQEEVFKRLRSLKLVRYKADADLNDGDTWIAIRPTISGLVHADIAATWADKIDQLIHAQEEGAHVD